MSKNAKRETMTMSARHAKVMENFSLASAMMEAEDATLATRESRRAGTRHISGEGIFSLEQSGVTFFEEATGHTMPHNLVASDFRSNLVVAGYRLNRNAGRRMPIEEADELIIRAARFGGWLKAAAGLRGVRKLIQKTQSDRGINSPYTTINLRALMARFPSPGNLERMLWAVKIRAEAILSAYTGDMKPSWINIGLAAMANRRVGKAAVIAVALQLGMTHTTWYYRYLQHGNRQNGVCYRMARTWLIEHRLAAYPVADATDGVVCQLAPAPELTKFGITVTRGLQIGGPNKWDAGIRKNVWLVRWGGRSFHSESGEKWALQSALRAWKRQDELAEKNRHVVSFLTGEETGACPLIRREDSYRAGNCGPGTEAWLRNMGWSGREFLSGLALIPHLDDPRVLRVIQAAREARAA